MKAPQLVTVKDKYHTLWVNLSVAPARSSRATFAAHTILLHRQEYEEVASQFPGMPWWFVGLIHYRESNLDFKAHLANGDPLTHRTKHVPEGLIVGVDPPYTFVQAAVAAIQHQGWHKITDWSVPSICYHLEAYNGWGYYFRGMTSPYLWAGSKAQPKGKFDRDDHFDRNLEDEQLGCMVILKSIQLMTLPTVPAPPKPLFSRVASLFPSSWSLGFN